MDGINSVQDLDKFLSSPLQPKQQKPFIGPPKPPEQKQPLPEVKSVQDLDSFLKSPLQQYDLTPVEKWKQARDVRERIAPPPAGFFSDEGVGKAIGIASKIDEPIESGIRRAQEFVSKKIDQVSDMLNRPIQKQRDWLAANGYPTLAKISAYSEAVNPVNWHREAFKQAAGMLVDPKMWPFMLEGAGTVRPVVKEAGTALFTVMQQYGALQALRSRDWSSAAMQEAFALLGMKDLSLEIKVKIGEAALEKHLDSIAQEKYKKPWNQLTKPEQAKIAYDLSNMPGPPVAPEKAAAMAAKGQVPPSVAPQAADLASDLSRGTAAARAAVPPREMPPPPEPAPVEPEFAKIDELNKQLDAVIRERNEAVRRGDESGVLALEQEKQRIYGEMDKIRMRADTGLVMPGAQLPDNESMYMSPQERSQRYYTLEEARKRLDEERRIASQEQEARTAAETEQKRIARERREQFEGEKAYREARSGKRLVVTEKRGLQFDEATAESNRQKFVRLSDEMDRIANEHMYYDAADMLYSLDTEKGRGRELDDWKKNVIALESRRRELLRLSNPELLEPTRTEAFQASAEDMALAKRESAMREAASKIEAEAKKLTDADEFERMTAEADEARDRAERLRTERDKKEAERVAATAEREEYPMGTVMDMVKGTGGFIILPDSRKIPFHYAVVPAEQVISSHDPFNNFEPNPQAIQVSQGRDYKNNRESQAATIARGKNPEMDLLVNTSPTAETGPPIVRSDGQALGGRNRVNIWKLLYKNGFDDLAYEAMSNKARELGVTVEQIANYWSSGRQPMVVRVLDDPYTSAKDLAQLGRDLDRTQTMGFSQAEEAVMAGRSISDKTLDWISNQLEAMGEDATLRDLMRYRGGEVVERMLESNMISPTQRAEYITGSGEMTEKGKNLFEAAVLGKVIDDAELLSTTPKEVLRKLERSVAALARVKAAGGLWDFIPELQYSLRLWKRVDSVRENLNQIGTAQDSLVDKYLNPGKFKMGTELMNFGGDTVRETPHPTVEALAKLLEKPAKEMKTAVGDYADDAEGKQITLGPPPSAVESFNRHIGNLVKVDVPDDAWGVMRPPEAVSEAKAEEGGAEPPAPKEPQPELTERQALGTLEGGVNAATLVSALEQRPGSKANAKLQVDLMGMALKGATGMDLNDWLKIAWSDIRTDLTSEQFQGMKKEALEQATGDVSMWARRAGRKLTITPYGEQLDIFGGAEPQFLLRAKGGDERLVLKSELLKIRDQVPRLKELVDPEGNITQPDMFGAEAENLFGPGEEEPDQGTLFQEEPGFEAARRRAASAPVKRQALEVEIQNLQHKLETAGPDERMPVLRQLRDAEDRMAKLGDVLFQDEDQRKLAEVWAKSKSVGAGEADWFTKAKEELFPGRRDLSVAEIGQVSKRAREMRIAAEGMAAPPSIAEADRLVEGARRREMQWREQAAERSRVEELKKTREFKEAYAAAQQGKANYKQVLLLERAGLDPRAIDQTPKILFQEKQGPWLYKSEQVLQGDKLANVQSGAQWAAMLRNKGVKADELKWMGIDDFLEGKKKVSKQELLDFIRENQLQVTEVAKADIEHPAGKLAWREKEPDIWRAGIEGYEDRYEITRDARGRWHVFDLVDKRDHGPFHTLEGAKNDASLMDQMIGPIVEKQTKYSQYTLPGEKKNYTELLITLPSKFPETGDPYELRRRRIEEGHVDFTTSHFDEPNILAHVRFDERTDSAGNRILFVEEVQSDWHQAGKKRGYADPKKMAAEERRMEEVRKEREALWVELVPLLKKDELGGFDDPRQAAYDAGRPEGEFGNEYSPETVRVARKWRALMEETERYLDRGFKKADAVPDAPFKTDWHELVMKRVLREAAERGYDKIAWVTGEQTADRYDLAKQVDHLEYDPKAQVLAAYKHGDDPNDPTQDRSVLEKSVPPEKLEDYIGKEIAKRLLDTPKDPHSGVHLLSGEGLKVGGEWAKALYDNAIPNFMRKYGKKWGASVGKIELGDSGFRIDRRPDGSVRIFDNKGHETVFANEAEFAAEMKKYKLKTSETGPVHSMDISPEMKKSVMEGQPLFQTKKGATEFLNDGKAVVYLFENADASTFLHEFFHTMRRYLQPEDAKVLEDWLKIKDGVWSRADEEKAARAWEYYHREAKPQTLPEKVAAVFKKIQTVMRQVYEQLKGSPLVKPSKEVSALFDRWYGREMEAPPGEKTVQDLDTAPKTTKYKFGNTQAPITGEAAKGLDAARAQIADEDTAGKGKDVDGNHVTLRYGIKSDDTEGIKDFLSKQPPFEAKLGKTDKFPPSESSDGAAVIMAPVDAPVLHMLNKELANHGEFTEPTFAEYKPHATVAYVKPEAADKYVGMDVTEGKTFKIDRIAISDRNGKKEIVRLGTKRPGEKIKGAADLEAPPLTEAERKDLTLKAQGGILPLDTGAVRTKVFPEFSKATEWAQANKPKIKGLQIFQLKDGRAVADFTAKNEKVLFQSDYERERDIAMANVKIGILQDRLRGIMSDAERAAINRQIRDLRAKREAVKTVSMEPPPGEVMTLWTPEGEREVKREQTESRPARTVPDEAIRLSEPPRPREVAERPRAGGIPESKPAAGRGVRTAGSGAGERAGVGEPRTSLRDVRPVSVAPVRPRGEAAYSGTDWANRVEKFKLPENAPAPTVQISDELARMLMPGQREVTESILSGLKQHDGYVLATTTGTGKTYMGSAVIADMLENKPDSRMLILTPSQSLIHGRDGWIQVAGNFGVEVEPLPIGETPEEPGVYIKTWAGGIANRDIENVPWDLVIMDEVQEARKWWSSQRGDMSKTMGENAKKILYTSATPFHTALEIGHMSKLNLWGREGFENWAAQNGLGVYRDKAGNLAGGNSPLRLEKLRQQLIERGQMINIDRNMDGYSAHFGKVAMDGVTSQGLKNIDQALKLAENYFERSGKKGMIQAVKAQRTTLAKRWLEYQRLPQAIELAKKLENEGWKVIFFSENKKEFSELFDFLKPADDAMGGRISQLMPKFKNTAEVLQENFGDDIAIFAGKHSAAREAEKDAFNDDTKKHLYATYGAGGVGVSLHDKMGDKPRAVIYLGPPWSGISFDQALGRPWRYGTKSNVRAYFLFSDSQAEMDLVTNKVAPRMESLRAMVSGVNFNDPVVKNLRAVPENQVGALDYDHGNAHEADFDQFTKRADTSGVSSYSELPIVSADDAKNKGMRLPGSDGAQDPAVVRLWQDDPLEDEVLPKEFEAPELTLGRQVNVELAERFIETGAAPGNAAGRTLKPTERRQLADAIMARAENAASKDPASATQQVYTEWENAMKQIDAILSGGADEPPLPPPPGEGIPNVPGGNEPPKPEKIGFWKAKDWYYFTNGRDVIRGAAKKAGTPWIGEKIARSIAQYHVEAGNIAGPWTTRYWDILKENKITPEEHKVLALTLANREKRSASIDRQIAELRAKAPMNDRIERAVKQTQDLFKEVFNRMQKDNIYLTVWDAVTGKPRQIYYSEFASGSGYWPRKYDYETDHRVRDPETGVETVFNLRNLTKGEIGASKREQIIRGMMDRYGISRSEVEDFLQAKKRDVPLVGHIERAREVDMPFFRTDPDVVISYLEGAGELLSRKKYFEQDGSKVKGLIAQIPDQKARNITADIVESLLKRNPMEDESRAWLRFAADWSVMKMTFSAIKVLGHPVHGAVLTNIRDFAKGLYEGTVDYADAHRRAQIAGSIEEQTKMEMLSEFGINKQGASSALLRWNGWQGAYKWGRVVADATARVHLTDTAMGKLLKDPKNEVVRRRLREFMQLDDQKIDAAIARRRWTDEDLAWAGKAFSDKVMFTFDPTELPPTWRARVGNEHPYSDDLLTTVRTLTLLKGYQFKTHALLKDAIWDEAMKGNFRPLIPFLLLYPAAGFLLHSLTALATANLKYFKTLMNDKSWTPGRTLWRMVDEIAHQIGDTALTAWLDAAVHGKESLAGTIGNEYFVGTVASDVGRTVNLPIELQHAKTKRAKEAAVKRYVEGINPLARTLFNAFEPPPGAHREGPRVLPHIP